MEQTLTKEKAGSDIEEEVEETRKRGRTECRRCGFQNKECNYLCSLWYEQNGCCVFTVIAKRLDLR